MGEQPRPNRGNERARPGGVNMSGGLSIREYMALEILKSMVQHEGVDAIYDSDQSERDGGTKYENRLSSTRRVLTNQAVLYADELLSKLER